MPECPMAGGCSPNSDRGQLLHPASYLLHYECHLEWCDSSSWFVRERIRQRPTAMVRDKSPQRASPDGPSPEQTPGPAAGLATCPHSEPPGSNTASNFA